MVENKKTKNPKETSINGEAHLDLSSEVKDQEVAPESLSEQIRAISERIKAKIETLSKGKKHDGVLATDLIKSEVITFFDWQRNLALLAIFLAVDFIIIFSGYKGVEYWQHQKQKEIEKVVQQFNLLEEERKREEVDLDKIIDLQRKLDQVTFLLNRHIRWTNFFKFLEENTLPTVHFENFSGSINGSYSLKAHAGSFYEVAQQINVLRQNPRVISVAVNGGGFDQETKSVNFDLSLVIKGDVFLDKK